MKLHMELQKSFVSIFTACNKTKRKIQLVNVLSGAVKSTMVKDRDNYDDFIEPSELANLLVKYRRQDHQ